MYENKWFLECSEDTDEILLLQKAYCSYMREYPTGRYNMQNKQEIKFGWACVCSQVLGSGCCQNCRHQGLVMMSSLLELLARVVAKRKRVTSWDPFFYSQPHVTSSRAAIGQFVLYKIPRIMPLTIFLAYYFSLGVS